MILLIYIAICGFVYYLFNELEDESIKNNWKKNQQYLNTNISWKNKWKLDIRGDLQPTIKWWWYFGIYPSHLERFFLSSTMLVFLTDGEHLFQFLKNRAIEVGFLLLGWQFAVAWIVGKLLMSFIKEKFLNWLQ